MRVDLAFPNRNTAKQVFEAHGFVFDTTDENGNPFELKTVRHPNGSFLMLRAQIFGRPTPSGEVDEDGLPIMNPGAVMRSRKGREWHIDAYLTGNLIEVTGYDEDENPIWGGDLLGALADYIVTIPENTAPAYVVAGVG